MRTTARNIQINDEVYVDRNLFKVVAEPRQVSPVLIMVPLEGPDNEYPYEPNEIVYIHRRSWHESMRNALKDQDETLDPYLEDGMLYLDFGHSAAVLITFQREGYTAVATAWAPDHGVDHEHVIVNGEGWEPTARKVAEFLREQKQREDEIVAAMGGE